GPADGMERSYDEILRLLAAMKWPRAAGEFVRRGARAYLDPQAPAESEATGDLVRRAHSASSDEPLYVVAIGAATNVAAALLLEPEIARRIVVVWLGGNALHWPDAREFNLRQDVAAARVLLD